MAKFVYGIDLGTTYSCIAYVDETGRATVINNSEGTNTTPSVVSFASPNSVVVGQVAKENAIMEPDTTISLVKRLIGKSDFAISYNGEDKSPEEVSAYILRKLVEDASKMINAEVKDVVITCPAYFGTAERTATKNAGIIAGLNVLEIISEPTAAALFYGCTKEQEEKTILVYDLGGGTFDVTIMSISANKIEVISSDGNHELGGKDWDEAVMRYIAGEFSLQTGFNDELDESGQQELRLQAEKAKQQLSGKDPTTVFFGFAGLRAKISFSRGDFDSITSALLNETIEKTDAAIAIAADKGYKIDEILLVGGSTRMPQVKEALVAKYNIEPKVLEPDEAVAKGAAIHAVNCYVNNQNSLSEWGAGKGKPDDELIANKDEYKDQLSAGQLPMIGGLPMGEMEIVYSTTKSYALDVIHNNELLCYNMIIKNSTMPNGALEVTREFGTVEANQRSVNLDVYENDFMDEYFPVDREYILGEASLDLPKNLPKSAPIEVTFILKTDGMLSITGRDLTSGNVVHIDMQAKGIMASEKVEELKAKSKYVTVI